MPKIILVGQRQGAPEAAAEQLEWPYFVLHQAPLQRPPTALEQGRLQCDFKVSESHRIFAHIQESMNDAEYAIPLTEGAVALAAALQDRIEQTSFKHQHLAQRLTHKREMKEQAQKHGIPCARFLTPADTVPDNWTYPCIVKTEVGSGSRGLAVIDNAKALTKALKPGYLAESFIVGKEFSVESFISGGKILFTNITDYTEPRWENVLPAGFSETKQQEILAFNARVIQAFEVHSGMTHLELFDTEQGLVFGEMARRPPGGYIMDLLAQAYPIDPWRHYLQSFTEQDFSLSNQAHCHVGVRMMHPGAGYLTHVSGTEAATRVPGAYRVKITKKAPLQLKAREGVGESSGYCMAHAQDARDVQNSLRTMTDLIHWHMT